MLTDFRVGSSFVLFHFVVFLVRLVVLLSKVSSWRMIYHSLLDIFRAEEFLFLFGVFMARVNLSHEGLIQDLYRISGSQLLLALLRLDAMLKIIWCDKFTEVM